MCGCGLTSVERYCVSRVTVLIFENLQAFNVILASIYKRKSIHDKLSGNDWADTCCRTAGEP